VWLIAALEASLVSARPSVPPSVRPAVCLSVVCYRADIVRINASVSVTVMGNQLKN